MFDRSRERKLVTLGFLGFFLQALSLGIFLIGQIVYDHLIRPILITSTLFWTLGFVMQILCFIIYCILSHSTEPKRVRIIDDPDYD